MIKINIIIAKRGRDEYLKLALHNFNEADSIRKYDIDIYIGEDLKENINKIDYSIYKNIKVHHLYISNLPQAGDLFCRGYIMDNLMRRMRQEYDFLCIADTDIVYRKSFIDEIVHRLSRQTRGDACLVANGFYTEQSIDLSRTFRQKYDYNKILEDYAYTPHTGSSQISFTQRYHEKIKKALNIKSIYDTNSLGYYFIGWGREDTLVRKIIIGSGAKLIAVKEAWVHIWHPSQEMKNESMNYNANVLSLLEEEVEGRMKSSNLFASSLKRILINNFK